MHQDGQYWPIRPLATCTVWLAIDDSDRDNGCLTVVPGSHRGRTHFQHVTRDDDSLVLNQAVDDPRASQRPPAYVELERGQLSMHDVYLVHGSAPNTSGRRRAGLAIRYMPSSSWFRRDIEMPFSGYRVNFATRPIWLVRGRILPEPRGEGGFGYDPLFFLPELGCSSAELSPDEKNRRSHRGKALRELARKLHDL